MTVGDAFINIRPEVDARQFEADLQRQLGVPAGRAADQLALDFGQSFRSVRTDADRTAGAVSADLVDAARDVERAFDRTGDRVSADLDRVSRHSQNAANKVSELVGRIGPLEVAAGLAVAALGFGKAAASAADLGESVNAIRVVLGSGADSFLEFGETAADALGLTQTALNSAVIPIAAAFTNAGIQGEQLSSQLQAIAQRGTDVGSVFNTDVNEVLLAFGSALRGEAEPARRFGVNLTAAAVEAEAFASGLTRVGDEVTAAAKQQAAYNLLLQQTAGAAGDFANTADTFANLTRRIGATASGLASTFGTGLLSGFEGGAKSLLAGLSDLAPAVERFGQAIGDKLGPFVEKTIPVVLELAEDALPLLASGFGLVVDVASDVVDGLVVVVDAINLTQEAVAFLSGNLEGLSDQDRQIEEVTLAFAQLANGVTRPARSIAELAAAFGEFGDSSEASIVAIDTALTALITGGNPSEAAQLFNAIAAANADAGREFGDVAGRLPGYAAALSESNAKAREAAAAIGGTASATEDLGEATGETVDELDNFIERFATIVGSQLDVEEALSGFESALDDLREVTDGSTTSLDLQTEAGRKNRDAFRDVVAQTERRIRAAQTLGASEAELIRIFDEGVQGFREAGREAGFATAEVEGLIEAYSFIPETITTQIRVDTASALAGVNSIAQVLRDADIASAAAASVAAGPTIEERAQQLGRGFVPSPAVQSGPLVGTLVVTTSDPASVASRTIVTALRDEVFLSSGRFVVGTGAGL